MSGRTLTPGEIDLAKRVFKDSIDYGKVKIHNKKYLLFQPDESGMTPNGEMYLVGEQTYRDDYSASRASLRALFIHEMVHVWQYQLKVLSPVAAAIKESILNFFDYDKAYEYELKTGKDLLNYRIEQQAQTIEDFYLWYMEARPPARERVKNVGSPSTYLPLYPRVLANFLANPAYARHMTACNRDTYGPPGTRGVTCTRQLVP